MAYRGLNVAWLAGAGLGNRRVHTLATIQARLQRLDFYLEARDWPSEFIFDHERGIAALTESGCPIHALRESHDRV